MEKHPAKHEMGGQVTAVPVSITVPEGDPSPFAKRRHPSCRSGIFVNPPETQTMQDMTLQFFNRYASRPYLGTRKMVGSQRDAAYSFITYAEARAVATRFGSGLQAKTIGAQTVVGVYSENSPEWIETVDASSLFGFTIASLYDSLGSGSLIYLMRHSRMRALVLSGKNAATITELIQKDRSEENSLSLELLILTDAAKVPVTAAALANTGVEVTSFGAICDLGQADAVLPVIAPDDPHFICYSSGTTGLPKGVILSHRAALSTAFGAGTEIPLGDHPRHLSYLPLAHVFERSAHWIFSMAGGRIGFISGGIQTLTDDLQALKPTLLAAVPRVMNRFYEKVNEKLSGSAVTRCIFWGAWYAKRFCIQRGLPTFVFNPIFGSITRLMGGSIKQAIVGGAALDPVIHEFLQVALGFPVRTGYGLTEAGSGNVISPLDIRGIKPGTVGGPLINAEVWLEPVAEFEDPNAGEIIISGQSVASGYLHDEEATRELFFDEARTSIRTGDVGKWDSDGYLQVIDRIRSIFKLSQGEYVSAELVTQVFEAVPIVKQIFVYGDSKRPCLVAVVVPQVEVVAVIVGKASLSEEEFAEACERAEVKQAVMAQLGAAAKEKLPGFQAVRTVHLEPIEWTTANELLTPTFKLKRRKLTEKYRGVIEQLYSQI
jgi:long-chain acyl-CoA synthetase